jgi:hypothetical protein
MDYHVVMPISVGRDDVRYADIGFTALLTVSPISA